MKDIKLYDIIMYIHYILYFGYILSFLNNLILIFELQFLNCRLILNPSCEKIKLIQ